MARPEKHPDLHGNAPDESAVALILIDVLNALDFPGSESFLPRAVAVGQRIRELKQRAKRSGVPTIYVNDNSGRWRSDMPSVVRNAGRGDSVGKPLVDLLRPEPDDYLVAKPKHSGFYATPLDTLLTYLRAQRLVLAGLTVERCVLFTANDAFLRDYELFVPRDCTAAIDVEDETPALRIIERVLRANTAPAVDLDFEALKIRDDD